MDQQLIPLLLTFPIVGAIIGMLLPKKVIITFLVISLLLLAPLLWGYMCVVKYFYVISATILLACLYSFIPNIITKRKFGGIFIALFISILFFIGFSVYAFFHMYDGQEYVRYSWNVDKSYRVEYVEEAGFSGRHIMSYMLDKFSIIPLYYKQIERVNEDEAAKDCGVTFKDNNMLFDRCSGSFIVKDQKIATTDNTWDLHMYFGDATGVDKAYYVSGKLKSETIYTHGFAEVTKNYYENGKLKSEVTYENNGKRLITNYDTNGNEIK